MEIPIKSAESVDEEKMLLISAEDLAKKLDAKEELYLIDVRSEVEHRMFKIGEAQLATRDLVEKIFAEWPKDRSLVVYDHFGKESLRAVRALKSRGFETVHGLAGGIDAWSQVIDPLLPRY